MQTQKILVFSSTKGYRHKSIDAGKIALLKMGSEKKWIVDTTEDATVFTEANLKQYGAVVFLSTTGNILNDDSKWLFRNTYKAVVVL
jgi:hypothetical protein